jgi:hypothetical protein
MGAKKAPSSLASPKQQNLSTTSNAIKATKKEKVPAKSKDNAATVDAKSGAKEATKKSEIGIKIATTATSIRKASTKPVLNNNAVKKSQITAAESKKNKSRDNSTDKSTKKPIVVNSKSKSTPTTSEKKVELNHEKCNKVETKLNSENSIKKCAEKESDKIKSMTSDSKHSSSNHTNPQEKC